jgi:hypothetical protein
MHLRVDLNFIFVYSPRDFQDGCSILEKEALVFIIIAQESAHLEYRVEAVVEQLVFVEHDHQPGQCLSLLQLLLRGFCLRSLFRIFNVLIHIGDALIFRRQIFGNQVPVVRNLYRLWS